MNGNIVRKKRIEQKERESIRESGLLKIIVCMMYVILFLSNNDLIHHTESDLHA